MAVRLPFVTSVVEVPQPLESRRALSVNRGDIPNWQPGEFLAPEMARLSDTPGFIVTSMQSPPDTIPQAPSPGRPASELPALLPPLTGALAAASPSSDFLSASPFGVPNWAIGAGLVVVVFMIGGRRGR